MKGTHYNSNIEYAFIRWNVGQPDNDGNNEHCVTVDLQNGQALLDDTSCDSKFQYICEV
jgi:hypothetical protein